MSFQSDANATYPNGTPVNKADVRALWASVDARFETAYTEDFDAITENGQYRGYNATGTPVADLQIALTHIEGSGGRAWQVGRTQQTSGGTSSGEFRRYRTSTGVWEPWVEIPHRGEVATAEQGLRADSALQAAAGDISYLFEDGSLGRVFDFSQRAVVDGVFNGEILRVKDARGRGDLVKPLVNTGPKWRLLNGRMVAESTEATDLLGTLNTEPLLPATSDVVLAWCARTETVGLKAMVWQHAASAPGRLQISANARFNGAVSTNTPNVMQVFLNGVTDGAGVNGMIAPAPHPIGSWTDFVLILRAGTKASEFWVNGNLIDTFTRPESIHQGQTTLLRHPSAGVADQSGQSLGRLLVLERAPADGELAVIRNWLRESFTSAAASDGSPWAEPTISSAAALIRSKPIAGMAGAVIWAKAGTEVLRPGSMTKLVTAYTGLRWLKQLDAMDTVFECQPGDATSGSGNNLTAGDTLDVDGAVANMGLPSSNVTTTVWARTIGQMILDHEAATGDAYSRFIAAMNAESARVGMIASTWGNASGLDGQGGGVWTTAEDLALLCEIADQEHPEFGRIWSQPTWDLEIGGPNARIISIGHSVDFIEYGDPRVTWGKTGTTTGAQNCMLCQVIAPGGSRYYYVGFGASSDSIRYADADAVFTAAADGVDWPILIPQLRR
ncbi:hypothetical protein [Paracoccus denitrificans]|uniref:hypothetical protein n=1 Tax=Paracoccus denitrificans TaxID=266 RepID=UPI0033650003